jgi:DNA polymerase-3 subunit delta'
VKRLLLSALRGGRLAHAYLFYGPEGVGKDAMAIELARVLLCERGGEEACGACPSCLSLERLQHPDVHFVTALPVGKGETGDDGPMAKLSEADVEAVRAELSAKGANSYHRISIPRANIIKINSVREIRRDSSLSTFTSRKRIFILSDADSMGQEAANTLLKTLEEPPGDCILILTTSHRDALLPTILSRCQQVRFDPLTEAEIAHGLTEREGIAPAQASLVARLAHGSYTRAVELCSDDLTAERQSVVDFLVRVVAGKHLEVASDIDRLADDRNREKVLRWLTMLLLWLRDALVLSHGGEVINVDLQDRVQKFITKFPGTDLLRAIQDVERAISLVERNVYIKLVLYHLVMHLKANIRR